MNDFTPIHTVIGLKQLVLHPHSAVTCHHPVRKSSSMHLDGNSGYVYELASASYMYDTVKAPGCDCRRKDGHQGSAEGLRTIGREHQSVTERGADHWRDLETIR